MKKIANTAFSCCVLSLYQAMPDVKTLLRGYTYASLKIGKGTSAWFIDSFACALHYEEIDFATMYSEQNVPTHHAQFTTLVSLPGGLLLNNRMQRVNQARLATALARDLLPLTEAIAVYWNSFHLLPADRLGRWNSEVLPINLWIAVLQDTSTSLPMTKGMSDFGLPELRFARIEDCGNTLSSEALEELLIVFADYLLGCEDNVEIGYEMEFFPPGESSGFRLSVTNIGKLGNASMADLVVSVVYE